MLSDKFKNVPVEEGTVITFQAEMKLGERDVLYQKWGWGVIEAESVIFVSNDVALLNDEQLESKLRESPIIHSESEVTIKRSGCGFTFVNFNFTDIYDDEGYKEPAPLSAEEQLVRQHNMLSHVVSSNDREIARILKSKRCQ